MHASYKLEISTILQHTPPPSACLTGSESDCPLCRRWSKGHPPLHWCVSIHFPAIHSKLLKLAVNNIFWTRLEQGALQICSVEEALRNQKRPANTNSNLFPRGIWYMLIQSLHWQSFRLAIFLPADRRSLSHPPRNISSAINPRRDLWCGNTVCHCAAAILISIHLIFYLLHGYSTIVGYCLGAQKSLYTLNLLHCMFFLPRVMYVTCNHDDGKFFGAMEWLMFLLGHHWWFFNGFDIVGPPPLNAFLRAQPLVNRFQWF